MRYRSLSLFLMVAAVLALCALPATAIAQNYYLYGTVEAEGSPPQTLSGVQVCAESVASGASVDCAISTDYGEYVMTEVPPGQYYVTFQPTNGLNYVWQYFGGGRIRGAATPVTITTSAVPGIDAVLARGATITGVVTAAATGRPVPEVEVCATAADGTIEECGETDDLGKYEVERLAAGSYSVYFHAETSQPAREQGLLAGPYSGGSVSVATGALASGIDAALTAPAQTPGTGPPAVATPSPIAVPPATTVVTSPALKCHRGFLKRKVRGKLRCVKHHRSAKHHHRSRKPGGHASQASVRLIPLPGWP